MVKVKLSLENYNKFINFIGKDWINENYKNFLKNPNSISHPFIKIHSSIQNAHNYKKEIITKEIYFHILLKNYQKYSFIGSFIDSFEDKLPNPTRFKNDLQNPDQFENTLFEIISYGILNNSSYEVEKKKEEKGKGNPDFYIKTNDTDFTVECTRRNIPDVVNEQSDSSTKLISDIESYLENKNINCQFYLSTSQSLKNEHENLLQLSKEVIDKKETGKYSYNNNSINFYYTYSKFRLDEEHEIKDFFDIYPSISMIPSNLGSSMIFQSNLEKVKNIREISINYEVNIYSKIRSTLLNKISKIQNIEDLPHHVFLMIPETFTTLYELDKDKLNEALSDLLEKANKINSVVIVYESFKKDQKDSWGYRIDWEIIENKSKEIKNSHYLGLVELEEESYIIDEDGMKKDDNQ